MVPTYQKSSQWGRDPKGLGLVEAINAITRSYIPHEKKMESSKIEWLITRLKLEHWAHQKWWLDLKAQVNWRESTWKRQGDQAANEDNANNVNQIQIVLMFSWQTSPLSTGRVTNQSSGINSRLLHSHLTPVTFPNQTQGKCNFVCPLYVCTSWMK